MAARQSAPVLGALCRSEAASPGGPRELEISIGYRYQPSSRHFRGRHEEKVRDELDTEITNIYHLFDVGVSYRLSPRWSVNGSLPILHAWRDQKYFPRGQFTVASIGDMTVGARTWLWRPPTESGGNVALGFSLKLPTGTHDATGAAVDRQGNLIQAVADQSIQAGDGAVGFALDVQAHKRIWWQSMAYFSGTWLFNPRNTNGVPTFRTRAGEEIMSVTDQYLFRGGVSRRVPGARNLVATFGGRIEGVPVRDALGKSDGFRRPGYAVSLDPGIMYSHKDYVFALNIPFAVERNRRRSTTDIQNNFHGDAAFADYAITIGVSRRFRF